MFGRFGWLVMFGRFESGRCMRCDIVAGAVVLFGSRRCFVSTAPSLFLPFGGMCRISCFAFRVQV